MQLSKADSVRLYKIRKIISELSSKEGRGTELVSLYIPPKKPIHEVISNLRDEWGTASNIKSDTTRNHVQDALVKTMQRLKLYRETPDNGLVIFCGALPTNGPGSEVIRLNEIVPPKPISTYLYMCVAPETKVLMDDRSQKNIGELKNSWTHERVMSWNDAKRELQSSSIQHYLSMAVEGRKTYRLTVESGRSIVATEDHPFQTPRGWVRLGQLRKGDLVCVMPLPEAESNKELEDGNVLKTVLFNEDSLRNLPHPPRNMALTVRRLKERGLLPLTSDNPRLAVVARILGHLFSDGSFYLTTEKRPNGVYPSFTFDFCVGNKSDEDELRSDFAKLSRKLPNGFETAYEMNVEGRVYTGHVRHVKLRDAGFAALFQVLGAPVGDKVKNGTRVPAWLIEGPLNVKREFLAAYLGGDATVPRVAGRNLVGQSSVVFHRITEKKNAGIEFANQLAQLLSGCGVVTNAVECKPSYTRGDGFATLEIRLPFKLSEDNILRLCGIIGVRYCSRKALSTSMVGEYLRIKSRIREENRRKIWRAKELRDEGLPIREIGEVLVSSNTAVTNWIKETAASSVVRAGQLPSFDEWVSVVRTGLQEPLLWESVVSIESEAIQDVKDLTIGSESHSFFANGFLVHNCDDHFHVEYLKDMLREEKVYGILSIDSTEAGLGILSGDRLEIADVITSGVSGKTRKGGQSARRYERLRDMELTYFFNRVGEHATRVFIDSNKVTGLIVGGPGPTKEEFLKSGYLHYQLQKGVLAVIDTGYSGREGVRETVEKASDVLQDVRLVEEKKLVQRFLLEVNRPNGLAIYGLPRIFEALGKASVETILVSDDVNTTKIVMVCKNCKTQKEQIVSGQERMRTMQDMVSTPCEKCGSTDYEVDEVDIVDLLEEKASEIGARVEVIASGTEEGSMLKSFGGVAALLRYRA